jgi:HD-GYP domain-containing protein (c-di-GMP phosphodiesterase class II)
MPVMSSPRVRLAEITGALTLAIDLAFGQSGGVQAGDEHVLRTCLLALRLAEHLDLPEQDREALYWVAQLRFVGCTGHAHEVSRLVGDEVAARADSLTLDTGSPAAVFRWVATHAGAGVGGVESVYRVARAVAAGRQAAADSFRAGCEVGRMLAERLELPTPVGAALVFAFERWDGRGFPAGARGEEIPPAMRIVQVAQEVEVFARAGGSELAAGMARRRAGSGYDPEVADVVARHAAELLDGLGVPSAWDALLDAEPGVPRRLSADRLEECLLVLADFADLKSPYTPGHSRAVAGIAAGAAAAVGLPAPEAEMLRQAALVHDLGRTAVPNSIWDKPAVLTDAERERVRLHPYHGERILARTALAPVARLAGAHHEQPDGGGYHRGLSGSRLGLAERLLAAADAYQALTQPRAWRPARSLDEAAAILRELVASGRLDARAVHAVIGAAEGRGPQRRRRPGNPAELTDREVDVLRLVARGRTNRQIAADLVLSPKTVGHHVERAYSKVGVSTRGAASLWCAENGLV